MLEEPNLSLFTDVYPFIFKRFFSAFQHLFAPSCFTAALILYTFQDTK